MRDDWRKAAMEGDSEVIAHLLAEGVAVNSRDCYGQTALMLAARQGQEAVVSLLLQHRADVDVTAQYGLSALMLAIVNRHSAIARQRVDAGANIHLRGRGAPGFAGKTALDLAESAGLTDLATYITRADGLASRRR
jgi:ankyrin repeat protein